MSDIAPWNRDSEIETNEEEDSFTIFIRNDQHLELSERLICNEATARLISDGVRAGLTEDDAAIAIGITPRAAELWKVRGKKEYERIMQAYEQGELLDPIKEEEPYLHFFIEVQRAAPLRKHYFLNRIRRAGRKTWQANAWILERLHPEEFAKRNKVEVVDWRSKIIDGIRSGKLTFKVLEEEFERPEVEEFFIRAGIPIPETVETREESGTENNIIDGEFSTGEH